MQIVLRQIYFHPSKTSNRAVGSEPITYSAGLSFFAVVPNRQNALKLGTQRSVHPHPVDRKVRSHPRRGTLVVPGRVGQPVGRSTPCARCCCGA